MIFERKCNAFLNRLLLKRVDNTFHQRRQLYVLGANAIKSLLDSVQVEQVDDECLHVDACFAYQLDELALLRIELVAPLLINKIDQADNSVERTFKVVDRYTQKMI